MLDQETALLVPPEPQAFAAGLKALAGDPALRMRLANGAAQRVRARYSLDAFRATVAALYRCLPVGRPSHPQGQGQPQGMTSMPHTSSN